VIWRSIARYFQLTRFAPQQPSKMLLPPFRGNDPRSIRPWRVMAHVLGVSAGELRNPVLHVILKKVDYGLLHRLSITPFPAIDRPIPQPLSRQQSAASLAFSSGRCKP
jgi:hypothetical protein